MTEGTHLTFPVVAITAAHWDINTNELVVDSTGANTTIGHKYLVEQYSTNTCADYPGKTFYVNTYTFNDTGFPVATIDLNSSLQNTTFLSDNGISFLGETINVYGKSTVGEPLLSVNPVAGEHIHTDSIWTKGCGNNTTVEVGFQTDYWTVRHVDSWNGFSDVWITSLIERPNTPNPTYYGFAFARNIGQVGAWCWESQPNYYSCGNVYIAEH